MAVWRDSVIPSGARARAALFVAVFRTRTAIRMNSALGAPPLALVRASRLCMGFFRAWAGVCPLVVPKCTTMHTSTGVAEPITAQNQYYYYLVCLSCISVSISKNLMSQLKVLPCFSRVSATSLA